MSHDVDRDCHHDWNISAIHLMIPDRIFICAMVPVFLLLALQLAAETTCNLNNCELAAIGMLWMLGTGNFASSQGLGVAA